MWQVMIYGGSGEADTFMFTNFRLACLVAKYMRKLNPACALPHITKRPFKL